MDHRRFGVGSISAAGAVGAVALAVAYGCGPREPAERLEQVSSALTDPRAVITQHNDISRTGATLAETVLNTGNVNPTRFGRIRGLPVRGSVVAQPLFVPNVNVNGTLRNVVYVATMRNLVYAFLASGSTPVPLWGPVSLGPSINLPDGVIGGGGGYKDIAGEVGIVSTPAISPQMNAMFVVAATKEGTRYVHRLHRLDLATGAAQLPAVEIAPSGFHSELQNQRAGLLLTGGTGGTGPGALVYIAFASYGDKGAYHGWVVAYDAATLQFKAARQTTTTSQGGIWMAGAAPAADSGGAVYVVTGNGAYAPVSPPLNTTDLGDSVIRLSTLLNVLSWFSPQNNSTLDTHDGDLGSSGPMLIPNTSLLTAAGKEGKMYLLQRDNMGYDAAGQPGVKQQFFVNTDRCPDDQLGAAPPPPMCHHIHGSPVFWAGPMGAWLYVWGEQDALKAFKFKTDRTAGIDCMGAVNGNCTPVSISTTNDPDGTPGGTRGMPGGFLSLSANGNAAGSGIVWALHPYSGDANNAVVEGVMRAYDASNLGTELWNTKMNADRDDLGPYPKGSVPTIADGRVYAATYTGLSRQVQLNDSSNLAPTLSIGSGSRLYLGWTGTDGALNVMSSTNGRAFGSKATLNEHSNLGPALAGDASQTYLGWIGTDGFVNVVRSTSQTFATFTRIGQTVGGQTFFPSNETSNVSLGLAVGNGRVYVAWTGTDSQLNLMSAPSGGSNFDGATKVTFNEQSVEAPNLTVVAGQLYLSWTGTDARLNIATLDSSARNIVSKRTLDESSNSGPVLVGMSPVAPPADLHVFWSGTGSPAFLNVRTADLADLNAFTYKLTFTRTSTVRPAAAVYGARIYLAWRIDDAAHWLNVARYNPGEVNVYGLVN